MKKKKVKAWEVKGWGVVDVKYPYLYHAALHRSLALKWRRENAIDRYDQILPDIKVIPCTITYEVPERRKSNVARP